MEVKSYRKLKNIDHKQKENNIASSALFVETADNIHALAEQYHDTLSSILDQHAPLITKTIRVRENTPWFNEEIQQAKGERRRGERKWRRRPRRLATDLIYLKEQRHRVCQMLDSANATFYHDKITACGQDSKSLFRLMDNVPERGHETHLPDMDSTTDIVNAFSNFFNFARAWIKWLPLAHLW